MEGIEKEESQSLLTSPGFVAPAVLPGRRVLLAVTCPCTGRWVPAAAAGWPGLGSRSWGWIWGGFSAGRGCLEELGVPRALPAARAAVAGVTLSPGLGHSPAAVLLCPCSPQLPHLLQQYEFCFNYFFCMNGACFCECSSRDVEPQLFARSALRGHGGSSAKRLAALCGLTFFLPGPFSAVQTPSSASTARAAPVLPSELCLGWNLSF